MSRTITVAAGVFAPGHLGELTQAIPFDLVDAVLKETGTVQRRVRDLPSRVGVYLLLAMGLFEPVGLALVWSKLVVGLSGLAVPCPSEKALRDLRRRLGPAPLKALFEALSGPVAPPTVPGVCYRRFRTVAFDGCSSIKVPDHERNRARFGKIKHRQGFAGYPQLTLMALVETGTRALLGAVFGPTATGEIAWATRLLPLLRADMLLLDDRGFDGNDFLKKVAATGAQFLVRAKANRRPPVLAVLPDGSYVTSIAGLRLRVIEARVTVTGADGSTVTDAYRLLTTLLDHRTDPAEVLARLYHERWEIESAFFALRHTIMNGRVLRSKDPVGIAQEMWALLALYQGIRILMADAAASVPGTDPDRCGFTVAIEAARDSVVLAHNVVTDTPVLVGTIGRAVLAALLPARRPRYSARKVKSPISRYHVRTETARPTASTAITAIDVEIREPAGPVKPGTAEKKARKKRNGGRKKTPTATTPNRSHPASPKPPNRPRDRPGPVQARPPGHRPIVTAILAATPGQSRRARDLARELGITGEAALNSFSVQMSKWARQGQLLKTAPATYAISL
jgi:hypothetical protein